MTKVAIITRTKDRPAFLKRALQSVARQSFTDYVHVIVNDGGDVMAVERAYEGLSEQSKQKVQLFHREVSSNAPDTIFNESIDRVKSEYVVIHDDDDTWHSDFLIQTVAHLDGHKDIAGVVTRTNKVIEETNSAGVIKQLKVLPWMPDVRAINLYRQCIDNQLTPIAFLFRRSAYEEVGKFDSRLPVCGDWDFGIRLLQIYDVDLLDPGFALANYHHRKFVAGSSGNNSFGEGTAKHRYYTNMLMNKYLRQELAEKRLGVGYIMSKLKYEQSAMATMVKRVLPSFISNRLKKRIQN